jgi:hypothetical protein
MSRSDGKFPSYRKYKIDSEKWPPGYWDKSYRCSVCATHWPKTPMFAISPCCDATTGVADNAPDMRWPEAVLALNEVRFDKLYAEWNEEKTDEDLSVDQTLQEIQDLNTLTEQM